MELLIPDRRLKKRGLLIFDLDGTLADTIGGIQSGVNLAMKQYGFPPRNREEVRLAIGNGAYRLIERCMPEEEAKNAVLVRQVYETYHAFYGETFVDCCLYDGILDRLAVLRERGYMLAVLSNKQDIYVRKIVASLFPSDWFSYVAGQTDLPKKPDPTVPWMIAKEIGVPVEQTAFAGDSEVDVQTAQNAGMFAVGCSWGYRERSILLRAKPHALLDKPEELTDLFL